MTPQAALHDPTFRAYVFIVVAVIVMGGIALALGAVAHAQIDRTHLANLSRLARDGAARTCRDFRGTRAVYPRRHAARDVWVQGIRARFRFVSRLVDDGRGLCRHRHGRHRFAHAASARAGARARAGMGSSSRCRSSRSRSSCSSRFCAIASAASCNACPSASSRSSTWAGCLGISAFSRTRSTPTAISASSSSRRR